MKTIRTDIHIDAPVDEVHRFGHNPEKWEQWYVNFGSPKILNGHGEAGTVIEADYKIMGVHIPVTIEVMEDSENHWEGKFSGAMEGEQIVNVVEEGDGSHVEMIWKYAMSNRLLNKLADTKVAEKMIERAMNQSIENWKAMCEMKH